MRSKLYRGIELVGIGVLTSSFLLAASGCAHSNPDQGTTAPSASMNSSSNTSGGSMSPSSDRDAAMTANSSSMSNSSSLANTSSPNQSPGNTPADAVMQQSSGQPADGQMTFDTDAAAAAALVDAAKNDDHDQVHKILGPAWKDLLSGDKVEDTNAFKEFAQHASESMKIDKKDATTSIVDVGADNWPFPIPIEKASDGKWFFDTVAGKNEILARRVGRNELSAIDLCRSYVRAQREYFRKDHDGSGLLQYAQRILSHPGSQDGLYYPATADSGESPFGPLVAQAEYEGYEPTQKSTAAHTRPPYHGYYFRILKAQGAHAPGGAYSYVINGHMVAGFALIAFPDSYRSSGVMTFIVNQNGKVYQKDLGPDTTNLAWKMTEYDPDSNWTVVSE